MSSTPATPQAIEAIRAALSAGTLVPYLGPAVLDLVPNAPVPASPHDLAAQLVKKVAVPHKLRTKLTAAAQYIENFKHRKTIVGLMNDAFNHRVTPSPLHRFFAAQPKLPLLVDAWYDNTSSTALQETGRSNWGQVQGLSQSEHFGTWVGFYDAAGNPVEAAAASAWETLLYKPLGGAVPAANYIISDSDYVEVLTEIDIQTPIPDVVQEIRKGKSFLFLGCRFNDQLQRTFARQVSKRSGERHWAVLPSELTRNELRFLEEQNITRIDMCLADFAALLVGELQAAA